MASENSNMTPEDLNIKSENSNEASENSNEASEISNNISENSNATPENSNVSVTSKSTHIYMDKYNIEKYCPDYPMKTDDISDEDYYKSVREYFKLKG